MGIEMCLAALISGTIEFEGSKLGKVIDRETRIVSTYENRTLYLLPDKYNLVQLCNKAERFPVSVSDRKKFELIK